MDDDAIFKALADGSRRSLLDSLFAHQGQRLGDLEALLPEMTRFGVMKHLKVLEGAGLVWAEKLGREKHHYLNPMPIQAVYDRWVGKFAQPRAQSLAALKQHLEEAPMPATATHSQVFETYIRTSSQKLWDALTKGEITAQYYFGSAVESTWEQGSSYRYPNPMGGDFLSGTVLEVEAPKKLVTTFQVGWVPGAPVSKVTYLIEEVAPGTCKLTLIHDDLEPGTDLTKGLFSGWNQILSGLKTVLETGEALAVPQMG